MFLDEKQSPVKRSVKLFPRLALANKSPVLMRVGQSLRQRGIKVAAMSERDREMARVRARLLKMILDNEGLRHNERSRA
jgi:hypothetical protein